MICGQGLHPVGKLRVQYRKAHRLERTPADIAADELVLLSVRAALDQVTAAQQLGHDAVDHARIANERTGQDEQPRAAWRRRERPGEIDLAGFEFEGNRRRRGACREPHTHVKLACQFRVEVEQVMPIPATSVGHLPPGESTRRALRRQGAGLVPRPPARIGAAGEDSRKEGW